MSAASGKSCPSCGERYDAEVLFCPQDGTPLASARGPSRSSPDGDLYVGLELAGQIRIKHLIGIGSMGRVYRAFQGGIERDVAVKILHRELSGNAELVSRFHREAKIASRLLHPNVVQVLMTGTIAQKGDPRLGGEMYLVMEHLDGISLLSALAAAGAGGASTALPLPRALHIVLQICDAVGEAHAQGIVHRDLKPENVMLVRRGDDPDYVKVLDFGIARLDWAERDRSMATQAGLIFGTAKYISPEGAEGKPVTPAADVYSIATILYQCLAGQTPFEGDSPVALLVQHTHAPPPDLRSIARASYVPAPIAAVVMANLAKKPEARAQDARAFGRELVAAARASGLDPDEITRSSLYARQGAVKLPSKERTKSLELSAELAAKIGGVAARPDATPLPEPPISSADRVEVLAPVSRSTPGLDVPPPISMRATEHAAPEPPLAPPSRPHPAPDLDFDDADPPPRGSLQSSMQGTESPLASLPPPPLSRRARIARTVAIALCALAASSLVLVVGGKRLGIVASASSDSVEGRLAAARDAMRRQAWDAPPGDNVKEILDAAAARWPSDPQVKDLRREAAERLVTSALGRKYAGDNVEALHLARLAVALNPSLTTAQHLVVELEPKTRPDLAPASPATTQSPTAGAEAPGSRPLGTRSPIRGGKDGKPQPASTVAPAPNAPAPNAPAPAPTAQPTAKPNTEGSPVLPPPPPPLPGPTNPSTGGPWL
ncbi:serine/threonine-protein kinase [Polyangium aurulentum]|uniref:serine/threonine-protein kinase n=1 Tax=Polyangium aurulentum TaxID=2567896 RepID=UPI0010AE6352|nr:serine/threonine-protein kinase [Polyangium aurulentum]UQA55040.1 serine/threonine protein kinase [Polyangium aurulentum]